ncbi:MAG: patatin-like phospholipase family protein [Candidatus Omnitrophota bacterium]
MKSTPASKVISIYSSSFEENKPFYAINLASAISKVTKEKVLLVDMDTSYESVLKALKLESKTLGEELVVKSAIGIDILGIGHIKKEDIVDLKKSYRYILINLPLQPAKLDIDVFSYSDSIHLFVSSIKANLEKNYLFLEDLIKENEKRLDKRLKIVVNFSNSFDNLSKDEVSWILRRNIFNFLPDASIFEKLVNIDGVPLVLSAKDSAYSKDILRVAKQETGKLFGLALGSGAAFGLAHIGVLKVLEESDIKVDIISGSSMGALIASFWGLGLTSEKIAYIAKKLKHKLNIMRLLDFTIPISGILAGHRLKGFLRAFLGEKTFEDLKIPVKIMVYDLANRETLSIDKGSLLEAVFMSIAVPGIFKPKTDKDRVIIDGGISDPVPVDILLKQGVNKIIAVNVLPGPEDMYRRNMLLKKRFEDQERRIKEGPIHLRLIFFIKRSLKNIFNPNIFDVIMTSMQSMEYMLAKESCEKASLVLHPVLPEAGSVDFHLVKEFIEKGEEEAREHLKEIKEIVAS